MRSLFCCLIILICRLHCIGQVSTAFHIKEVFIKDTLLKKTAKDFKRKSLNFYEDEKYIVRKTCSGEWGGSVFFKDKKTGIEYSCSATCPVVINKINSKYIITATLNHMLGSTEIIEIKNPKLLAVYEHKNTGSKNVKNKIRYVGDDESKSVKGAKILLDTMRMSAVASFVYKGELFHVITDYEKTFLAKIANKRFITIGTVSNKSIWTYDPEVIVTTNRHSVVFFRNSELNGYLDIFDNNITLYRYR